LFFLCDCPGFVFFDAIAALTWCKAVIVHGVKLVEGTEGGVLPCVAVISQACGRDTNAGVMVRKFNFVLGNNVVLVAVGHVFAEACGITEWV
jgi:hypothetical protein